MESRADLGRRPVGQMWPGGIVLFGLLLSGAPAKAAEPVHFAAPALAFSTVGTPREDALVGDFNGDGRADVVVSCSGPNGLEFLAGVGAGQLAAPVVTPTAGSTYNMAAADMNGDGHLDVLLANVPAQRVSVFPGAGDGTFGPPLSVLLPGSVEDIAVGDLDGVGAPDVAATLAGARKLVTLLGQGDGSLTIAGTLQLSAEPRPVAIGDLNGDGHGDVAVALWSPHQVSWWAGQGDGTLGSVTTITGGSYIRFVDIQDLDGDEHLDLFYDFYDAGNLRLAVHLGLGGGALAPRQLWGHVGGYQPPAVVDVNDDGILDVVQCWFEPYVDFANSRSFTVTLLGDGAGGFPTQLNSSTGSVAGPAALADMDGDGRLDLVASNLVARGHGDGTFGFDYDIPAARNSPVLGLGDLNGDGHADLVTAGGGCEGFGALTVQTRVAEAPGLFGPAIDVPVNAFYCARGVAQGDFDADGDLDVAITRYYLSSIEIRPGLGDGTLGAPTTLATSRRREGIVAAHLNGDARPDLAAIGDDGVVAIFLGLPGGGFAPRIDWTTEATGYPQIAAGLLNGDSYPDLLVTGVGNVSDVLVVLPGIGGGAFGSAITYPVGPYAGRAAIGDFNEDGRADVVIPSEPVTLYFGQPGGSLGGMQALARGTGYPVASEVHDVDQDGHLDLLILNGEGRVDLFRGLGDGTFQFSLGYAVGGTAASFLSTDLNGDGLLDLVTANYGPSTVTRLIGVADQAGAPGADTPPGTRLTGATPNPFRRSTRIHFEMNAAGPAQIDLFDIHGRRLRGWNEPRLEAGRHELTWDGRDAAGLRVGAGTYFLRTPGSTARGVVKVVLVH